MIAPFEKLSEASGVQVAAEAAAMLATRYLTATDLAAGKRVLELACSTGPGLRLLASTARSVVGADVNTEMLTRAQAHYRGAIPLVRLSAECLPFAAGSFDLVLFLEATYYVADFERALDEIARVLAPDGSVLFVNANPQRVDFIPSPFSHHYHSADEFRDLLGRRHFDVQTFGAFRADSSAVNSSRLGTGAVRIARRILNGLGLVPKTLRGRARLKRLLGQKLRPVPAEIDRDFAPRGELTALGPGPVQGFKVVYVIGRRTRR